MKIQSFRGFRDILPAEIGLWHKVEAAARELFHLYGYAESRTPALEKLELFSRGVGQDTDIVQKEMYVIRNEREVVERLSEAREWHYAFATLARHGRALGISFAATARTRSVQLQRLFERYGFPGNAETAFEACLQG